MQRMNSLFSSVARTFSADLRAERHHASISIPSVPGSFSESHAGTDIQGLEQGSMTHAEQRRSAELRSQSLPTRFEAPHPLQTVGSVADSECSLTMGSPTAGALDTPSAAAAEVVKPLKKQYKIHGMDAYDYWSLIKSL